MGADQVRGGVVGLAEGHLLLHQGFQPLERQAQHHLALGLLAAEHRIFDGAVEYAVFRGQEAQGEVMLRLALERLEALVQKQMALSQTHNAAPDLIRTHGLLGVVRRRGIAA